MQSPNEITAITAILHTCFAVYALRFALLHIPASASGWFARWAFIITLIYALRLTYWDVILPGLVVFDFGTYAEFRTLGNWLNSAFNVTYIGSTFFLLGRALLLSLPDNQRDGYHIWNVWFHPRKLQFRWRK